MQSGNFVVLSFGNVPGPFRAILEVLRYLPWFSTPKSTPRSPGAGGGDCLLCYMSVVWQGLQPARLTWPPKPDNGRKGWVAP